MQNTRRTTTDVYTKKVNPIPPSDHDDRTRMRDTGAASPTPIFSADNRLATGTKLGEFEITGLVGEGGFGIVYLAYDHSLEREIALKEYMPSALAARTGTLTVSVKSERHQDTFQAGLKSFINEARLLARFDHASLVKVYRFWEANGTAYMVMPFYRGLTLKETLRDLGGAPDEAGGSRPWREVEEPDEGRGPRSQSSERLSASEIRTGAWCTGQS